MKIFSAQNSFTAGVAVLVDGENVSACHAGQILKKSRQFGPLVVVRVYANASRRSEWSAAAEYNLVHAGTGKNAADLLLSIDAIELAINSRLEAFVIATSDGDFRHLALRLRERGHHVVGIGEAKAPKTFRLACSDFAFLRSEPKLPAQVISMADTGNCTNLDRKIYEIIAAHGINGMGMRIADLARMVHSKHGTRISTYPERNWRTYLARRADLYDLDERGPDAMVRFRKTAFTPVK